MKKILILICLTFWTVFSYSQLTPVPRGNANQIDAYRGINTGLVGTMLTPNDTTNSPATTYYGALTVLPSDAGKDTIPIWMSNGVKWIRFSGGNATTINDTIYTRAPIAVDRITLPGHQILYLLHLDGIVSPGYVVWTGFGLDFNVTPAEYYINYRQFFSPFALVTLATAPVSDSRVDLFIVDTTATSSALTGMAGPNPVAPQTNPSSQLPLTTVTVNAGDTVPSGIALETIFNEHIAPPTEWLPTTNGSIAADFNNPANPYIGDTAIFVSTYANGSQIIFTKGSGTDTVKPGQIIRGFVSFNIPFTSQFQFQWFNGATAVSNSIAVNSGYGINPNNVNNYQIFAIPLNAWNFTPASNGIFNKLVITMGGADTSGAGGFYMDYLQLQTGLLNPTNADYLDSVYMRNDSLFQYKHGIEYFRGKTTGGGAGGALANFYLKDSSLSSDRNVDGATHDLSISNVDVFQLGANTSFGINAPSITLAGTTNSFQGSTWDWNDGGSNHYLQLSSTALTINQAWSLPFVDGTANQVLTTNGSGVSSWQDASGGVTADNGLNISSGSNVQLGGTLLQATNISAGAIDGIGFSVSATDENREPFTVTVLGTSASGSDTRAATFNSTVNHTTGGENVGVFAYAVGGDGLGQGVESTGGYIGVTGNGGSYGLLGVSTNGFGTAGTSTDGLAGFFQVAPSSTNTVVPIINIVRSSSGTAANNIGGSIDFKNQNVTNSENISTQLISKWTNATYATRTSEFTVTGVNSSVIDTVLTISGNGATQLNRYAGGAFDVTDTTANKPMSMDAGGNIKRLNYWPSGGGGGNTIYTGDGSLPEERVIDINGNALRIINGSNGNQMVISPTHSTYTSTDNIADAGLTTQGIYTENNVFNALFADDGVKATEIFQRVDTLTHTSYTNIFSDAIKIHPSGDNEIPPDYFFQINDGTDDLYTIDITGMTPVHTFTGNVIFNNTARLKGYTVSTLPAGVQGDMAYVTDALLPSFLVTVAGSGSVVTPVFYDGSSWKAY